MLNCRSLLTRTFLAKALFFLFITSLLTVALGTAPALPTQAESVAPAGAVSPEGLLNPDGTLDLSTGFEGTLDLSGWEVTLNSERGPVLEPASFPTASSIPAWYGLPNQGLNNTVYALAIVGTLFVCAVVAALHHVRRSGLPPMEYILVFRQRSDDPGDSTPLLDSLLSWRKLHGVTDLGQEEGCEYTYRVRLAPAVKPETLLSRLKSVAGLSQLALISPESQLAI